MSCFRHHKEVLPTANGFDTYYGIPYSNDMNHPDNKGKPRGGWEGMDILWKRFQLHPHQVEDTTARGRDNRRAAGRPAHRPLAATPRSPSISSRTTKKSASSCTSHTPCRTSRCMYPTSCAILTPRTPTSTPSSTLTPRWGRLLKTLDELKTLQQHLRHLYHRQRPLADVPPPRRLGRPHCVTARAPPSRAASVCPV